MKKEHILDEIKRTAKSNAGIPLGMDRFSKETGIREADWLGKHWVRWNDAVREAGFEPNKKQDGYGEDVLVEKYIQLVRELGHPPVKGELLMKRRKDLTFPAEKTFRRFGSKQQIIARVLIYCKDHPGFSDVAQLCQADSVEEDDPFDVHAKSGTVPFGFVYLLKSGRYYKIGRSNSTGRREYEIRLQQPEKLTKVHEIKTDDPVGIEDYWHRRFEPKRKNGEWFELSSEDVQAFRRRKFM